MNAKICIIGAGSSGMTVGKALGSRGIDYVCYEKGSDVGGMWRYKNDNGQSSCYASLHIDTSKTNLGYRDFPINDSMPDFLSHTQFLGHLEAYADQFRLRDKIQFNTTVETVSPLESGNFNVMLASGESLEYEKVVVANGHLSDARMPHLEGEFSGSMSHSHDYRTADPFVDKRVLVVGLGNSAVDIAVDLCRRAEHVTISTRRSAWLMPKYLMGRPVDQWSAFLSRKFRLSTPAVRRIMSYLIRLGVGDQRRFGLPRPSHPMWREHATLSQELLPYIGHGWINIQADVASVDGDAVLFVDGSQENYDAIICATGYKTTFPFLDNNYFQEEQDVRQLYRRMVSLDHQGLVFAGLVQPVGATIPLVEQQGEWIAAVMSNSLELPERAAQQREVDSHCQYQDKYYMDSKRYLLEVDYKNYAKQMRTDIGNGVAGE